MTHVDLYTPSGIGDIYWILQKLARTATAQGVKLRIHTPPGPGDKFARGKFLEFIDCVESVTPDGIDYKALIPKAKHYSALESTMYCECNTWLEKGNRLEHYMPAFPTEFVLNWQIGDESKREAQTYIKPDKKNIVVYTSGRANNDSSSTGRWKSTDWAPRLKALRAEKNLNLIWIGANYDTDLLHEFQNCFDSVLIDKPADVVLSLLRLSDGFISYQSGLSCISVVEEIPTLMLYFKKIEALTRTFNPPGGTYEPVFFDDMPDFVQWVRALPIRAIPQKVPGNADYTFWVNQNVEKTEKDWLENPWIHEDQYESIKHLDTKADSIIEFGCGSGQLARRINNANYVGCDQSGPLLELAQTKSPNKVFNLCNIREAKGTTGVDHVVAFGFLKHFSLSEHDDIFARLASFAKKTLTIEIPIRGWEHEDRGHDFPHTWVTDKRMRANATKHGFKVSKVTDNRSWEKIYHMERVDVRR